MPFSFYRKYRPQKFKEVISQDHIKKTLIAALQKNRITHAYLFTGPKGTGKTTVARLLAKSLNCQKKKDVEPCNRCQNCQEIIAGKSLDLVEIDAASNRGIDEVRQLRENVKFAPSLGEFKVVIIDECHMLTREAFNALLKTLEEPPSHVIFVLATTEPHKVPATILSRCQRFDFKRAKVSDILKLLSQICQKEKLKISSESLGLIANLSDGAFRDGISFLDQIASLHPQKGREITLEEVRSILGLAKLESALKFIEYLLSDRKSESFKLIEDLYNSGTDFVHFNQLIISVLRKLLMVKLGAQLNLEEEQSLESLKQKTESITAAQIFLLLNLFLESQGQIKTSFLPQLPLELAIVRASSILSQESVLPQRQSLISEKSSGPATKEQNIGETLDPTSWEDILKQIKPHNHSLYALLKDTKPLMLEQGKLVLAVQFKFHKEKIMQPKNCVIIEQVLSQFFNRKMQISCILLEKEEIKKDEEEIQLLAKDLFGFEE